MSYHVRLTQFEGPLDLLLHLIRRDKINIYDIPISHITNEYLSYIEVMQELKLDRLDVVHRSEGPGRLDGKIQVHTLESLPGSMKLPDGFERRPEFMEIEKELLAK